MLLSADALFGAYLDDARTLHLLGTNESEQIVAEVQADEGQIVVKVAAAKDAVTTKLAGTWGTRGLFPRGRPTRSSSRWPISIGSTSWPRAATTS